jgi:hypothetical protein
MKMSWRANVPSSFKRAAGMTPVEAVLDYVRDAAFTTLQC